ncbi:MAG: prolyl aminopeptidase, partial [Planctomycetes bacterium]|nr:prolyl aminopeptidase [Planctomycetota bacterium]
MMYLLAEQTSVSAGNWILLLLDATLKGSVILIAAVLLDSALRSTSASNRYRMWCCALCSLAAIPLLAGVLPKWQVPLLPNPDLVSVSQASDSTAIDTKPPIQLAVPEKAIAMVPVFESRAGLAPVVPHFQPQDFADLNILAHLLTQEVDSQTSKDDKQRAIITQSSVLDTTPNEETSAGFAPFSLPDWHWSVWVVMIWVTGTLGLIVYLFAGVSRIAAITRSAIPLDDEDSTETLRKLSRQAGVLRPVRLLHCRQIRIPMTWGHLHPVILLPTSCINWSKTRRRIVLLHELVHIRRGDWLMQIASQLICAAYWCNPLVWIATRRLCIERERACDDQVLGFGTRPTVYASHLLDIARNIASGGSLTMASLGMAHRSQLEGRLLSILDPGTKRHGFGRIATLTAIIGMGAGVMPLAAIQPWAESTTREIADPIDDGERNIETTRIDGEIVIKSDGKYNFNWTEDDVEYRIRIRGKVVLTEDGVESISDDGYLRIIVEDDDDERRVVIRMGEDGDLSYDLRFNGEKRKLSDKARRWVKRVVRKTVHQIQKFEASMDELDENMKHLDIEMKEMKEQLHEQLSEIEIPDMENLHLQLKKLSELHEMDFGDLHIQFSELDIPDLEGLHKKLAVLHDLKIKDLDNLHIRIPNIKVLTDINVKKLDKLKKLNRIRIKEMREQAGPANFESAIQRVAMRMAEPHLEELAGASPEHRRFFDPGHYRVVIFDQRGAGRSTPLGETENNTTGHLVADIEALRERLGIERWQVFGGSWGSTLALAYAQAHPERVTGLILRGIFLCRKPEIDWFLYGMRRVFPETWRRFAEGVPEAERDDLLGAYHKRLIDPDPEVHLPAARAWSTYEGACSTLRPSPETVAAFGEDTMALGLARMEAHYFSNGIFLEEGALLDGVHRIRRIPGVIIQGR